MHEDKTTMDGMRGVERGRGREGVEREEDEVKTATTLRRKTAKSSVGTTTATVLRSIANGARGRA